MIDQVTPAYEAYRKKPSDKTLEVLNTAMRETAQYRAQAMLIELIDELASMQRPCGYDEQNIELLTKIKSLMEEYL